MFQSNPIKSMKYNWNNNKQTFPSLWGNFWRVKHIIKLKITVERENYIQKVLEISILYQFFMLKPDKSCASGLSPRRKGPEGSESRWWGPQPRRKQIFFFFFAIFNVSSASCHHDSAPNRTFISLCSRSVRASGVLRAGRNPLLVRDRSDGPLLPDQGVNPAAQLHFYSFTSV